MTLRRDQIEWACADSAALIELLAFGMDEVVELRELAEHEWDRGEADIAQHLEQEASAWGHTVRLLRAAMAQAGIEQHTGRHRRAS